MTLPARSWDLTQFNLATPTSHVQATGSLSAASSLRLSVTTSSLADWLPLVAAIRGPALIPVSLNGRATFNGNLTGSLLAPQLSGNLQVDNFDVQVPATRDTPQVNTRWDSLSTSIQLSFDAVALHAATLRREGTSAQFDASATLQHGHFDGHDTAVTFRANMQNASLPALQALAGYNYPLTGKADLFVQGGGNDSHLHGAGQIHLTDASAYGEIVQQFDSNFRFDHDEVVLEGIHLFTTTVVTGSAALNPTTHLIRLDLTGKNIDLGRIRQIQSDGLPVAGRADFTLFASGAAEFPDVNAEVQIHELTLDQEVSGDLNVHAIARDKVLHVSADSHLNRGSLDMKGDVVLRADDLADVVVHFDGVDLDALWRAYLGPQLTDHSATAGTLRMRGPVFHPSKWIVDGDLNGLAVEVENVKLRNQDAVRFVISNASLSIQQLHLLGGNRFLGSRLTAARRSIRSQPGGRRPPGDESAHKPLSRSRCRRACQHEHDLGRNLHRFASAGPNTI